MYTIDQIHNLILFIANKQQNDFISHDDIDSQLDLHQMAYFSKLTGRPEANKGYFSPQKSGVRQDQWFNDALNPFKKTINFLYEDTPNGLITLPNGYMRLNSLYIQYFDNRTSKIKYKGVQILGDDLIPDALSDPLSPLSIKNAFGEWSGINTNGNSLIQLHPSQPMAGRFTYLSRPPIPKYYYVMNGRQVVFNPALSTNLLWNDEIQIAIIMSTMQTIGLNISQPELIQFSEMKQQGGTVS